MPLGLIYHGAELRDEAGRISAEMQAGLHGAFTYLALRRPRLEQKVLELDRRQVRRRASIDLQTLPNRRSPAPLRNQGGGGGGGEPPRRASRSKADPNEPRHFNKNDDDALLVLFKVGARSSARVGAVMRGRHHARGC